MRAITPAATASSEILVGDADGDGFPAIVSLHRPASRLSQRRRSGHRMDVKPRSVGVWEDFLGEAIIALLAGSRPNEHVQPPIHPSDCRGCQ